MRSIKKPVYDSGGVYSLCISKVKKPALKSRLALILPDVKSAAEHYDKSAKSGKLHSVASVLSIRGVSKIELNKVYTKRMAAATSPGRCVYDELLLLPANRRCPLCGQRDVSTLDHHLPEARYPIYSVTPLNLVPACHKCNFNKKSAFPTSADTQTFHPYYDDFDDGIWLIAFVMKTNPVSVFFEVSSPASWNAIKSARARHHFKLMQLSELYSTHAASDLAGNKWLMEKLLDSGGIESVRGHIAESAESWKRIQPNSWQAALYTALSADDWFCSGGLRQI